MPAALFRLAALVGITLIATAARAQSFDAVRLFSAAPGQDGGTVGAALIASPAYRGSDERRTALFPLLDYQWGSGWFAGVTNGIGINLSTDPRFQYGLRLTADLGRKQSRADALRGMGDVKASLEGGGFFNMVLTREWVLTSSARLGSGEKHRGFVVDIGAGWSTAFAPSWRLGVGAGLGFANARHLQAYYGVTPAQAATSGYAVTTPGSGARDLRASTSLTYAFDARTSVTGVVAASRLLGDAASSPLTRRATGVSGVIVGAYAF